VFLSLGSSFTTNLCKNIEIFFGLPTGKNINLVVLLLIIFQTPVEVLISKIYEILILH